MENTPAPSRVKLWPCVALALLASGLALTSLWLAVAPPPPREIPTEHVAGTPGAVATCIAEELGSGNADSHDKIIQHAQVAILKRDGEDDSTTRLIIDGSMRVHAVITLSRDGAKGTEASLTTVPNADPAPELARIIRACAQKN